MINIDFSKMITITLVICIPKVKSFDLKKEETVLGR